jgi:pSer/pThr/pTyr-binding forkhead associated (FHA) protein
LIGRGPQCEIRLPDRDISLRHAQILLTTQEAFLVDLGSTNGTRLNAKVLPPDSRAPLRDGDAIEIGSYRLTFSLSARATSSSPAELARELARELLVPGEERAPSVTVLNGPQAGLRASFAEAQIELLLGRGEECDLCLVDAGASRRHALLSRSMGGVTIEDLGSRHGTRVDGVPIEPGKIASLRDRAELQIGQTRLAFHDPEELLLATLAAEAPQETIAALPVPAAPPRPPAWEPRERALLFTAGAFSLVSVACAALFWWEV